MVETHHQQLHRTDGHLVPPPPVVVNTPDAVTSLWAVGHP